MTENTPQAGNQARFTFHHQDADGNDLAPVTFGLGDRPVCSNTWRPAAAKRARDAGPKFIAIRQAHTKVIGSRVMTRDEAEREVSAWRDNIGPACYVVAYPDVLSMVRRDDTEALAKILYETFPSS